MQTLSKPYRVARRVAADVIVEIREHGPSFAKAIGEPCRPFVQCAVVVSATVSCRTVKPGVNKRADGATSSRRARHLVDTTCNLVPGQQIEDLLRVPARIAEFDDVPSTPRQAPNKCFESFEVDAPPRRQLVQHGSKRTAEQPRSRKQPVERLRGVLQFLHVGEVSACLDGIEKPRGSSRPPLGKRRPFRQAIERVVDLNSVKLRRVVFEPAGLREVLRIECPTPVAVLPPRTADACGCCDRAGTRSRGLSGPCRRCHRQVAAVLVTITTTGSDAKGKRSTASQSR